MAMMEIPERIKLVIGDLVIGQITQQHEIEKLKAELHLLKKEKEQDGGANAT